jgi:outer membrane autotransporter protein
MSRGSGLALAALLLASGFHEHVSAAPAGVTCGSTNDASAAENPAAGLIPALFLGRAATLSFNIDDCSVGDAPANSFTLGPAGSIMRVLNNVNTDMSQGFTSGISVSYGANVTNVTLGGGAYPTGTQILLDVAGAFSQILAFDFAGSTYSFFITKPAGSTTIDGFTISAAAFADTASPTIEIRNGPANLTSRNPFHVTFQVSEDVTGFDLADIVVANGAASNFVAVDANTYAAEISPASTGDVTITVPAGAAFDGASNANLAASLTVDCGIGCDEAATVAATQARRKNFAVQRLRNLSTNTPALAGLLTGHGLGGGIGAGSGISVNVSDGMRMGNFALNLMQFANTMIQSAQHEKQALGAAPGSGTGPSTGTAFKSDFNIWAKGTWVNADEDRGNTDEHSDFFTMQVGADYRHSRDLLFGLMAQMDRSDEESRVLGSKAEGTGWLIGPYVVSRLTDELILDLNASCGRSENEFSPLGTYTDEFDSNRVLVSGNLTGSMNFDSWHISPSVGLVYIQEEQEAYTDSLGFRIDSQDVEHGSLNFGPTVYYEYHTANGWRIEHMFGLKGIYDFVSPDISDVTGVVVGTDDLRAQSKVGVSIATVSGTTISASYSYDGIGVSDYNAQSAEFSISMPLRIRGAPDGISVNGSYSLIGIDATDANLDHNAMVTIKMPFD